MAGEQHSLSTYQLTLLNIDWDIELNQYFPLGSFKLEAVNYNFIIFKGLLYTLSIHLSVHKQLVRTLFEALIVVSGKFK